MIWQQTLLSNEKSHLPNSTHSRWVDTYNTDSTIHLPQARETAKIFQVFICLLRKQQCYGGKQSQKDYNLLSWDLRVEYFCMWLKEQKATKKRENKGKRERRGKQDRNGKNSRRQRGRKTLIARRNAELLKVSTGIHRTDLMRGLRHGNPLQYSCLENPMNRGAWSATVHGFAKSRIQVGNFSFFPFFFSWHVKNSE